MTISTTHLRLTRALALLLMLAGAYGLWLITFWPGVLGEDSVAVLQEVRNPEAFRSGKTVVWYYFVKLLYGTTARVEVPIVASLLLCAVLLTRMLDWYWKNALYKTFFFVLLTIALAPHMIYFMGTLYLTVSLPWPLQRYCSRCGCVCIGAKHRPPPCGCWRWHYLLPCSFDRTA